MNQKDVMSQYQITKEYRATLIKSSKKGLRPLLTCHIDTINTHYYKKNLQDLDIVVENNIIKLSENSKANCLGGDDDYIEKVVCESCGEHLPLYELNGMLLCHNCVEFMQNY